MDVDMIQEPSNEQELDLRF